MIPGNRLAILLDHVKQNQINQCLYHNTASPPSLYSDHMCDRADFPLQTTIELCQHTDEVWYCEFSHDGTKLVTAGRDRSVIIYDTSTFDVIHKLSDHEDGVAQAVWSPDDTRVITCSQDKKARVWCVEVRSLFSLHNPCLLTNEIVWSLSCDGQSSPGARYRCRLGCRWRVLCHGISGSGSATLPLEYARSGSLRVAQRIPCSRLCHQCGRTSLDRC